MWFLWATIVIVDPYKDLDYSKITVYDYTYNRSYRIEVYGPEGVDIEDLEPRPREDFNWYSPYSSNRRFNSIFNYRTEEDWIMDYYFND